MVGRLIQAPSLYRRYAVPALVGLVLLALFIDIAFRPEPLGVDFHTYAAASLVGMRYGWSHMYDQALVIAVQAELPTRVWTQPFLSPPPVAWMVAPLLPLPYAVAFFIWVALLLAAFIAAVAWSTYYRGIARIVAVGAAVAPWWVFAAVQVGQVALLIAAGVLVAWRLLREDRDVAAGIVLAVVLLKPNTALLAPVALAFAGRFKAFGAWVAASAVVAGVSLLSIGAQGTAAYIDDLMHMPRNILHSASLQTIEGTFGLSGVGGLAVRAFIVVAALATAYRFRQEPWLAMVAGAMASLATATYLHPSDICLFIASGWIVWHERRTRRWRAFIFALWFVTLPFLRIVGAGLPLNRWLLLELAFLLALCADSWMTRRATVPRQEPLTASADIGKRLPA